MQAAHALFTSLHLERWAFDTEIMHLCERLSIPLVEVAVRWHEVPGSKLIVTKVRILKVLDHKIRSIGDPSCMKDLYHTLKFTA